MNNSGDLQKLIELGDYKDKFKNLIKKDMKNKENVDNAKKMYEKYHDLYKEITGQEPRKSFDDYLEMVTWKKYKILLII